MTFPCRVDICIANDLPLSGVRVVGASDGTCNRAGALDLWPGRRPAREEKVLGTCLVLTQPQGQKGY